MSELTLIPAGPFCMQFAGTVRAMMASQTYPQPVLYDADYVMMRVYHGEWQLWFVFENDEEPSMMMLTIVNTFPGGKSLHIELVVGRNFFRLAEKNGVFERWCRFEGIRLLSTSTPEVLAQWAVRYGWKRGNISVYKELERVN